MITQFCGDPSRPSHSCPPPPCPHHRIRYFQAGEKGPCLLLLHGFGVGAYHWERNIKELSQSCRVFAVDVLGQGEHSAGALREWMVTRLRNGCVFVFVCWGRAMYTVR